MIQEIIRHVKHFIKQTKINNPDIHEQVLKAALVYQYLHYKYNHSHISIIKIIKNHSDIGLIGYGSSCLTMFLQRTLGCFETLQSHGILHDAYGRYFLKYNKGPGYTYTMHEKLSTKKKLREIL